MRLTKFLVAAAGMLLAWSTPVRADGLEDMAFVRGIWVSKVEFQTDKGNWGQPVEAQATGQTILGGAMVEIDAVVPFPGATFMMRMTLAYDRFNKAYRMVVFDDINGYADLYSGGKAGDGSIVVDNASSGTAFPDGKGGLVIGRITLSPAKEGWKFSADVAPTKGGPWSPYMRMTFSPRK